jgi:alanyl-tRNA synthetase
VAKGIRRISGITGPEARVAASKGSALVSDISELVALVDKELTQDKGTMSVESVLSLEARLALLR